MKHERVVLGTIGSRAPFHSHKQNRRTKNAPDIRREIMMAEFHAKVVPPYGLISRISLCDNKSNLPNSVVGLSKSMRQE